MNSMVVLLSLGLVLRTSSEQNTASLGNLVTAGASVALATQVAKG